MPAHPTRPGARGKSTGVDDTARSAPTVASRRAHVLEAGQGEAVWFLDNLLTIKAAKDHGAEFGVLENAMPAGSHTPFHVHDGEDEAFYVLEGNLVVHLDGGRLVEAGPGAYVHIPRGTPHGFVTRSPVRLLVLCGVDGFVEMAREAGVPAPRRELPPMTEPDVPRLAAACERHRIRLLGPLPS
jgi:quercetin dioxygenase-like cupin family protein